LGGLHTARFAPTPPGSDFGKLCRTIDKSEPTAGFANPPEANLAAGFGNPAGANLAIPEACGLGPRIPNS